jgi:uncharacterized protein (TIGR02145 family)
MEKEQFCDSRDGKKYVYVTIGTQTWMAENLNYEVSGSKCGDGSSLSEANTSTCDTYGRLYNWATAMALPSNCNSSTCSSQVGTKHKGICPSGWHIPSDAEWTTLTDFVGGLSNAGTKLKAKSGWNPYNGVPAGTDAYGFSALPGGDGGSDGSFYDVGIVGSWWSATEYNASYAWDRGMGYYGIDVYRYDDAGKSYFFSVRCLKD